MNTKPITEYNKNAIINIAEYLELSNTQTNTANQTIIHKDFNDIGLNLLTILEAIEIIGFSGNSQDIETCAGLAQIAKKLLPINELDFLDSLLIKNKDKKQVFYKIDTLK
ncbi:hypothetical protein K5L04_10415 [Flavobacterium psychrophilum]|uniref:hypothetical protein n=1 Tax=Flavobacterium psychrophilum TaxID=96345 RepID=UPI001C8F4F9C|nr:hypothetical protein [Flavobacterium psychrophilum]QZL00106.1 hypothetical protein K5L04_10415 [Flavobacterium psychrophilum]